MFVWFSLPAYLSVIIADVGLTNTEAGVLVGAIPLTYIPLALVSGLVVDRFGPGRTIALGALLFGGGQVGRSIAPEFLPLLAFTILMGIGATTVTFGLPKLVSLLFPPGKTGRPSAIYLIAASAGSALAFAIGRPILGPLLGGWRELFLWSGLVVIGYGLLWFVITYRYGVDELVDDSGPFRLTTLLSDLRLVLTHRELQLVVIVGTMYLFLNHGIQGWLPTVLESRGISPTLAGQATSLFVATYVVGILGVPELSDRLGIKRLAVTGCGILVFFGVAGVIVGGTRSITILGIAVTGFGTGGISPLLRTIPPELDGIGTRLTGTAVGFIFAVGEIGGFAGPVLIGLLHDVTGSYAPGFGLLATGGVVVVVAGLALTAREDG